MRDASQGRSYATRSSQRFESRRCAMPLKADVWISSWHSFESRRCAMPLKAVTVTANDDEFRVTPMRDASQGLVEQGAEVFLFRVTPMRDASQGQLIISWPVLGFESRRCAMPLKVI